VVVKKLPEKIDSLAPGQKLKLYMELIPRNAGEYRIRPVEIYYEDQDANRYVKASNQILIEVVQLPPADYKNHTAAVEQYIKYAENQKENKNYYHNRQ